MSSPMENGPARPAPTPSRELAERPAISDAERALGQEFRQRYASWTEAVVVHRSHPDPKVTLIVISYRAKDYLLDCLRHLRDQTPGGPAFEVLLADSGGLEHLRGRYDGMVDVELRLRSGLPLNVARNAAAGWARGEYIAFIDDDGLVSTDWVAQAVQALADPTVAFARGKIVPHRHPYFNVYAGHYDRGDALWDDDSLALEGNMVARRAIYLEIGGFPDEFYGSEGCYLVFKLKRAHPTLRSVYAPGMVMQHDYCRSMREFVWKCRRYRTVHSDATRSEPEYAVFLERYRRSPKPTPRRTLAQRAALRLLRASEWVIVRSSIFDRVQRRAEPADE